MNNIEMKADIRCEETKLRKKLRPILRVVYWILTLFFIILGFNNDYDYYPLWTKIKYYWCGFSLYKKTEYKDTDELCIIDSQIWLAILIIVLLLCLPFILKLLFSFSHKYICKNSFLSVDDERVEGAYLKLGIFKKSFTFPIEQIVNIVSVDSFIDRFRSGKTLVLHTSSGKIKFSFVQNAEEVSNVILNSVKEYKENYGTTKSGVQNTVPTQTDEVEKLKQYKELLDSGVINQEEFEAKKKELLNL